MENLLNRQQLERLLVANWAHTLDARRLMSYVMTCVRDAQLPKVEEDDVVAKHTRITISRFEWNQAGFLVWADFSIPLGERQVAVGTTELVLGPDGGTTHVKTVGTVFVQRVD